MRALVAADGVLFFEHADVRRGQQSLDAPGGCESDDAAADDEDPLAHCAILQHSMVLASRWALIAGWIWFGWSAVSGWWRAKRARSAAGGDGRRVRTEGLSMWGAALETVAVLVAWAAPGEAEQGVWRPALAGGLALASAAFFAWAVRHLGRQFRVQAVVTDRHELVETGPYAMVRHPMYAAVLALTLATGLARARWEWLAAAMAIATLGTEMRVHAEEKILSDFFGDAWKARKQRVWAYLPPLR